MSNYEGMMVLVVNYELQDIQRNSTEFVHLLTEVQRLAYADRAVHLGDPDFWNNPIDMLISKEYANETVSYTHLTLPTKA